MSSGLRHEEAHHALEALALDALDASERAAVMAHVDGCAACRTELAALVETAAQLAHAVRPVPMSDAARDRVRRRLMHRASERRAVTPRDNETTAAERIPLVHPVSELEAAGAKPFQILVPHPAHEGRHEAEYFTSQLGWWLAAAASLVAAVSLASLYQVTQERDAATIASRAASADGSSRAPILDSLRADLEDRDRVIANLTGPNVAVMTLAATGPNAPSARMFWNHSANAWTFVAHNLPMPAAGRRYQLWLVTAKQKISAGTFMPGINGDAMMHATYELPANALAAVAVTDEPEAGSAQPTTTPVIAGVASAR
jgi:anti-sigma factor RsiW